MRGRWASNMKQAHREKNIDWNTTPTPSKEDCTPRREISPKLSSLQSRSLYRPILRWQTLAWACLLCARQWAHSQDLPAAPMMSVDVKVVTLPVTVRDKHGQIVPEFDQAGFPSRGRRSSPDDSLLFAGIQPPAHTRAARRHQLERAKCSGSRASCKQKFSEQMLTAKDRGLTRNATRWRYFAVRCRLPGF